MTREEKYKELMEKANTKVVRLPSGTYAYKNMRISKTPSSRITKGFGWDVRIVGHMTHKHFRTLKEAKDYVLGK